MQQKKYTVLSELHDSQYFGGQTPLRHKYEKALDLFPRKCTKISISGASPSNSHLKIPVLCC